MDLTKQPQWLKSCPALSFVFASPDFHFIYDFPRLKTYLNGDYSCGQSMGSKQLANVQKHEQGSIESEHGFSLVGRGAASSPQDFVWAYCTFPQIRLFNGLPLVAFANFYRLIFVWDLKTADSACEVPGNLLRFSHWLHKADTTTLIFPVWHVFR